MQLGFHPFALGNVTGNRIDQLALWHSAGIPEEPSVRAVLAEISIIELNDIPAFCHLCRVGGGRGLTVVWMKKLREWPGQHLLNTEPESRFPGRVHQLEISVEAGDTKHVYRQREETL